MDMGTHQRIAWKHVNTPVMDTKGMFATEAMWTHTHTHITNNEQVRKHKRHTHTCYGHQGHVCNRSNVDTHTHAHTHIHTHTHTHTHITNNVQVRKHKRHTHTCYGHQGHVHNRSNEDTHITNNVQVRKERKHTRHEHTCYGHQGHVRHGSNERTVGETRQRRIPLPDFTVWSHTHDKQGLLTGVRPCWGRGWGGLGCCCLGPVGEMWCKIEVQVDTSDVPLMMSIVCPVGEPWVVTILNVGERGALGAAAWELWVWGGVLLLHLKMKPWVVTILNVGERGALGAAAWELCVWGSVRLRCKWILLTSHSWWARTADCYLSLLGSREWSPFSMWVSEEHWVWGGVLLLHLKMKPRVYSTHGRCREIQLKTVDLSWDTTVDLSWDTTVDLSWDTIKNIRMNLCTRN